MLNLNEKDKPQVGADFERFCLEHGKWSDKTFGSAEVRGPLGPLKHLEKEVEEAKAEAMRCIALNDPPSPELEMEIVDCFFLSLDAARRAGMSPQRLMELAFVKLEINKARIWPVSKPGEATEHVRCADAQLPDGPVCPSCGGARGPSGVDGGSWVHMPKR